MQRWASDGGNMRNLRVSHLLFAVALAFLTLTAMPAWARTETLVAEQWRSTVFDADAEGRTPDAEKPFQRPDFDDREWKSVSVPHNWQGYSYNRQVVKGARHGTAWYRTAVEIAAPGPDERVSLMFEGVNSYATVWLNGHLVGRHGGGLTSFTFDVTAAVKPGRNLIAVRVDNPAGITDLPWVSGDDQPENGFAEGSQPFGIFRPVHVVRTAALSIRPFGLYAWGEKGAISPAAASLTTRTEMRNRSDRARTFEIVNELLDPNGRVVASARHAQRLAPGAEAAFDHALPRIMRPKLWSPASPTLYTLRARVVEGGRTIDEATTPFGLRSVEITTDANGARRLMVNGSHEFIRGTAEYEHLLGNSHAFSPTQIGARVSQVEAGGFNAFRDGHYPHNMRYGDLFAERGILWWTQFSAHIWFDNPAFRRNFKTLLADWVRERRNNPAVFMWGLQNESVLPAAFAREAVAIIRELDPTASVERLITTCNGGEGTDWNVPQNWSGTYGGDPDQYADQLVKQGLVGEYGAWRSLEMHAERPHDDKTYSEDRFTALMGKKARLADSVADRAVGDFQWLLSTHENPGRPMRIDGTQIWDGVRALDHVGPANNKGLMTLWGEPLDAYYLYRALHVPAGVTPMVYLVSHTWPDRWAGPGVRSGIEAFSNCDAVELFNGGVSLGRRAKDGTALFRWDGVAVRTDRLTARCIHGGRVRAEDSIRLHHLPRTAPTGKATASVTGPERGRTYLYRVNVGGPDVTDRHGQRWAADRHRDEGMGWGWRSWADAYPELDPGLGSRRPFHDLIDGTADDPLFQSIRYGRDQLEYSFAVPDGRYRVELYFVEPWYGRAGIDATGWRRFDVAVNDRTVLRDLDIFAEAGFGRPLRKTVEAESRDGRIVIRFPRVDAGQAVLSAIAISGERGAAPVRVASETDLIARADGGGATPQAYLDNGQDAAAKGGMRWTRLPAELLDSDWFRPATIGASGEVTLTLRHPSIVYMALPEGAAIRPEWQDASLKASLVGPDATPRDLRFVSRRFAAGARVSVPAGWPTLVRRALPSPYAPGVFTLSRQKGVYEAEKGTLTSGRIASDIKGYGGNGFVRMAGGSIEWPAFEPGIAAQHGLQLRYALPVGRAATTVRVTLLDTSGIAVSETDLSLSPGEGWQVARATTPTAINAGKYHVQLTTRAEAIAIDSLTIE